MALSLWGKRKRSWKIYTRCINMLYRRQNDFSMLRLKAWKRVSLVRKINLLHSTIKYKEIKVPLLCHPIPRQYIIKEWHEKCTKYSCYLYIMFITLIHLGISNVFSRTYLPFYSCVRIYNLSL